jgi:hypothetical protein
MSSVSRSHYYAAILITSLISGGVSTYLVQKISKADAAVVEVPRVEEVKFEKLTTTEVELIQAVAHLSDSGATIETMNEEQFAVYIAASDLTLKCLDINLQFIPNSADQMMCEFRRDKLESIRTNGEELRNRKLLDALNKPNEQR